MRIIITLAKAIPLSSLLPRHQYHHHFYQTIIIIIVTTLQNTLQDEPAAGQDGEHDSVPGLLDEQDRHPELQALYRVPAAAQPEGQLRHLLQRAQQRQEQVKFV